MSFDSIIDDFSEQRDRIKTTPDIVKETFDLGQKLINQDYLPKIQKIKKLKKFLVGFKSLNLYTLGWRFQFGKSREWAGLCSQAASRAAIGESKVGKNIFVSIEFIKHDLNWKQNMQDVIYHEIAHGLLLVIFAGKSDQLHKLDDLHSVSKGHGVIFKAVCHVLCGHECRIFYENANYGDKFKPYKYTCTFCGHVGYGNSPHFTDSCSECNKSVLIEGNV